MSSMDFVVWGGFVLLVLVFLALDLGVFNRTPHVVKSKEALAWTGIWVGVALLFNVLVYFMYEHGWLGVGVEVGEPKSGGKAAIQFLTAYLVEKSLSLDNIFVIAVIFGYFGIPGQYQHRVLFWGILGALVMRGVMIGAGIAIVHRFDWVIYIFGALLIVTAVRMLMTKESGFDPSTSYSVRLIRKAFPVTSDMTEGHFLIKQDGKRYITPLGLALVMVETADVAFAVDSIPAVFAVTLDPFIVFTSNVFAILGLRSLYFALADLLGRFRYLKYSLVFILAFVGVKMLLAHHYPIPVHVSLGVLVVALATGVLASLGGRSSSTKRELT